eukprot:Rmarinus@m.21559
MSPVVEPAQKVGGMRVVQKKHPHSAGADESEIPKTEFEKAMESTAEPDGGINPDQVVESTRARGARSESFEKQKHLERAQQPKHTKHQAPQQQRINQPR